MRTKTACEVIRLSEHASEMKKNFICAQDELHQTMLSSPWPVLFYVAGVLMVMFLVFRAANAPHQRKAGGRENGGG